MKEIKFRMWLGGRFHYWGFVHSKHGVGFAGIPSDNTDSISLKEAEERSQQFTGLLDKSGKEIWEGDIVYENYFGLEIKGEIVYTNYSVGIKGFVKEHTGEWSPWEADDTFKFGAKYHEVIGNVYEHPELLKGGNREPRTSENEPREEA